METLRTFGHYSMVSEKIDRCPWKYTGFVDAWSVGIGIISLFGFLASGNSNNILYGEYFASIFIITFCLGMWLSSCWYSCGTKIYLTDNNYDNLIVKSTSYQFTTNSEIDALEIKKIMDDFEKYANDIDVATKKREDEESKIKKECCNKYKSVIQKVK